LQPLELVANSTVFLGKGLHTDRWLFGLYLEIHIFHKMRQTKIKKTIESFTSGINRLFADLNSPPIGMAVEDDKLFPF
jgi:hypothetical protein